jgi:hypothetical protein
MCAARAIELYEQQAKERQQARKGNQAGASPENLPELKPADARDAAGKAFGVESAPQNGGAGNRGFRIEYYPVFDSPVLGNHSACWKRG